jgi:hypothetical protein
MVEAMDVAHPACGFKASAGHAATALRRLFPALAPQLPLDPETASLPRVPPFRAKSPLRLPAARIGTLVLMVAGLVVVGGLVLLAVIEPRPTMRHFEVQVPGDRLGH